MYPDIDAIRDRGVQTLQGAFCVSNASGIVFGPDAVLGHEDGASRDARRRADRGIESFGIEFVSHLRALRVFGRRKWPFGPKRMRV